MTNLAAKAWIAVAALTLVMGALLFVPAGTFRYWQGWIYLLVFTGASVGITGYLMNADPALLARRMRGGPMAEERPVQKLIMLGASIGFVSLLVVPALDHRFGWSTVPLPIVVAGDLLVAIGFYLISIVYRVNTFTSATIEIAENQSVVSTGPYAIVRHPMYLGGALMFLATPPALASLWGVVPAVFLVLAMAARLLHEEKILARDLAGYDDYRARVRARLIPGVW